MRALNQGLGLRGSWVWGFGVLGGRGCRGFGLQEIKVEGVKSFGSVESTFFRIVPKLRLMVENLRFKEPCLKFKVRAVKLLLGLYLPI